MGWGGGIYWNFFRTIRFMMPQAMSKVSANGSPNTIPPESCTDSLCECGCVRSGLAAVVRWQLGNWSFGFSVPGFPSRQNPGPRHER